MAVRPSDIWENWKNGTGACFDCPHRDCDGYFRPKLTDRESARVMVVGHDPNDVARRTEKDSSEIPDFEWEPRKGGVDEHDYLDSVLSNSWSISGFIDELIEYFGVQPDEIYLTNQKKCSNVGNDPFEGAEAEARQRCMEYLQGEIEYLEPEVVLICGSKPIPYFNEEFGLSLSTQTGNDAGAFGVKNGRTFVTAPNFGYYRQNIARFSDYADTEEFFKSIGNHLSD